MKKLLSIFLIIFSSQSFAEWTYVTGTDQYSVHIDLDRIRKADGFVFFWQLQDYPEGADFKNAKSLLIFIKGDCSQYRFSFLSVTSYSGSMMSGTQLGVDNINTPKWDYAQPNSVAEGSLNAVCK